MLRFDLIDVPQELTTLVDAMAVELGSREQAWAVVLKWLADSLADEFNLSRLAARVLRHNLKPVDCPDPMFDDSIVRRYH